MKCLYYNKIRNTAKYLGKDKKWHIISKTSNNGILKLHYGEMPVQKHKMYFADELPSIFKDCYNNNKKLAYGFVSLYFNRRIFKPSKFEVLFYTDNYPETKSIKEEDISYISVLEFAEKQTLEKFTFEDLSRALSAKEFLAFCKDNGLNTIKVIGESNE